MTNKSLADFIGITEQALYKWRKERPNLFAIAMFYKEHFNNIDNDNIDLKNPSLKKVFDKISNTLKLGVSTLYQWQTTRPELYTFLLKAFSREKSEIETYYSMLDPHDQEMYLCEIKAKVLRKQKKG